MPKLQDELIITNETKTKTKSKVSGMAAVGFMKAVTAKQGGTV